MVSYGLNIFLVHFQCVIYSVIGPRLQQYISLLQNNFLITHKEGTFQGYFLYHHTCCPGKAQANDKFGNERGIHVEESLEPWSQIWVQVCEVGFMKGVGGFALANFGALTSFTALAVYMDTQTRTQ